MNRKCVSAPAPPPLSHLHSQTEIAGFGAAIIFASLLLALPVPPLSFQSSGGGLKLLHVTHSGEKKGGENCITPQKSNALGAG